MAKAERAKPLKLAIELVPETCWEVSLSKLLPRKRWDTIRKSAYQKAGHRCEICGSDGKLYCHEKWKYDDKKHIRELFGFVVVCSL